MLKDIENPMVNDDCWPDYEEEEQEDEWEKFCRMADEEYDSYYDYCRRENGYYL